jgi:hypothetical protein
MKAFTSGERSLVECDGALALVASSRGAYSGGFDAPTSYITNNTWSHVLFAAADEFGHKQQVISQPLPVQRYAPFHVAQQGQRIPGRRYGFDAFMNLCGDDSGHVGFIGLANTSAPIGQRYAGIFVAQPSAGFALENVVDTMELSPTGLRWIALSAPALLEERNNLSAFFSGVDSSQREMVIRWRASDARMETLLDSAVTGLHGLSAPQLCELSRENGEIFRWLTFLANHRDRNSSGGLNVGVYALALSERGSLPMLVAGERTFVPSAWPPQRFLRFGGPVAAGDGRLVFVGQGDRGSSGIYVADLGLGVSPSLRRLVDTSQSSSSNARFASFLHAPSPAAGLVTFMATTAPETESGVYAMPLICEKGSDIRCPSPWPVVTLRSANLTYILERYSGFDGKCLSFYASARFGDGLYVVDPRHLAPRPSV